MQLIQPHLALSRKIRVRRKLRSRSRLPRLSVFRSHQHTSAQIIDDQKGVTLVAASETDIPQLKSAPTSTAASQSNRPGRSKIDRASLVGQILAKKALKLKLTRVVFDRGRYQYHGRIKALAEAARNQGLKF